MLIRPQKRRELKWWAYILTLIVLIFLVPFLMSARDDLSVVTGVALMTIYGVITWKFWVRDLIKKVAK